MVGADPQQPAGEAQQVGVFGCLIPVDPRQFIVLAVDIVVAVLGACHLITVGDHRRALGQQQGGEEVASLLRTQLHDLRVIGWTFHTTVPGTVVGFTITVVFTIGHVVLLVVTDQVIEGEAIMGGDEVDGCGGAATIVCVQVGGTGQAGGEFTEGGRLTTPEITDGIAVLTVPFSPQWREITHLVSTFTNVPWLGDQLCLGYHRILLHQVEEGGQTVNIMELTCQGGGEVEAETINVHLRDPITQGVHEQLQ